MRPPGAGDHGERQGDDGGVEAGDVPTIYLHPGRVFASARPVVIQTILGSCVAVCLWDVETGIGGMNHFLLPQRTGGDAAPTRYGDAAIEELVRRVERLGGVRRRLRARIFGGACLLDPWRGTSGHLGERNVELADALLEQRGIPVVERDVRGARARRLTFRLPQGSAHVRYV